MNLTDVTTNKLGWVASKMSLTKSDGRDMIWKPILCFFDHITLFLVDSSLLSLSERQALWIVSWLQQIRLYFCQEAWFNDKSKREYKKKFEPSFQLMFYSPI